MILISFVSKRGLHGPTTTVCSLRGSAMITQSVCSSYIQNNITVLQYQQTFMSLLFSFNTNRSIVPALLPKCLVMKTPAWRMITPRSTPIDSFRALRELLTLWKCYNSRWQTRLSSRRYRAKRIPSLHSDMSWSASSVLHQHVFCPHYSSYDLKQQEIQTIRTSKLGESNLSQDLWLGTPKPPQSSHEDVSRNSWLWKAWTWETTQDSGLWQRAVRAGC